MEVTLSESSHINNAIEWANTPKKYLGNFEDVYAYERGSILDTKSSDRACRTTWYVQGEIHSQI